MTSRPSRLGAVSYETESSWAEATDTWGTRLQVLGEPVIIQNPQQRIGRKRCAPLQGDQRQRPQRRDLHDLQYPHARPLQLSPSSP